LGRRDDGRDALLDQRCPRLACAVWEQRPGDSALEEVVGRHLRERHSDIRTQFGRSDDDFGNELLASVEENDDVAKIAAREIVASAATGKGGELRCKQIRRGYGSYRCFRR
jgi:hypothetical protein